MESMPQM